MNKIYLYVALSIGMASLNVNAQSFTVNGPRTIWNLKVLNTASGLTTSTGAFALFNFETGKSVNSADSATNKWNIGFFTNDGNTVTRIIVNSGVSGPGLDSGQVVNGISFENFSTAPSENWKVDGLTSATKVSQWNSGTSRLSQYNSVSTIAGLVPGSVFDVHTITPVANRLLILKLASGKYVKLELLSNYKNAPTSIPILDADINVNGYGYVSFRYLVSNTTFLGDNITHITNLNANLPHYQFFNLAAADTVNYSDSASSQWDFAFKTTTILTNGGSSGPGAANAQILSSDFGSLTEAPASGYNVDGSSMAIPTGSGNGWYNYDFISGGSTHTIYPIPNKTIASKLFSTSEPRYAKIIIQSYNQGAPVVACSEPTGYYTFSYYYNPYGTDNLNFTSSLAQTSPTNIYITGTPVSIPADGTGVTLTVASAIATWTATRSTSTGSSWIVLSGTTSSGGNASFSISASSNTGAARSGSVVISFCNGVGSKTINVSQAAGTNSVTGIIDSQEAEAGLRVYPNPTTGQLNLDIPATLHVQSAQLVSINGKENIIPSLLNQGLNSIDLTNFPTGLYILKLETSNGLIFKKVQIQ